MASALSATVWSASSTSVLLTDRIAWRSLISSRPMISALAEYSSSAIGKPPGGWPAADNDHYRPVGRAGGSCPGVKFVTRVPRFPLLLLRSGPLGPRPRQAARPQAGLRARTQ